MTIDALAARASAELETKDVEIARLTAANEALVKALEEGLRLFDLVTALDDHGSDALGQAEITFRNALSLAKGEG
jgi:hypothetical protein